MKFRRVLFTFIIGSMSHCMLIAESNVEIQEVKIVKIVVESVAL